MKATNRNFINVKPLFLLSLLTLLISFSCQLSYALSEIDSIKSISLKQYRKDAELILKTSKTVQFFSSSRNAPPRITIEFKHPLVYAQKKEIVLKKGSPIKQIKLLTKPSIVKKRTLVNALVLELKEPLEYEISKKDGTIQLKLSKDRINADKDKKYTATGQNFGPREKKKAVKKKAKKTKKKISTKKKQKGKNDPARIIEADFIKFIKKARKRWKKEDAVVKKLLAKMKRKERLQKKRLKQQNYN